MPKGAGRLARGATFTDAGRRRLAIRVDEAARLLGLSRAMVYQMVARGELPHVRVGRAVIIPVKALEEWLESRTET
jgi:excisionase family DNA binding protein